MRGLIQETQLRTAVSGVKEGYRLLLSPALREPFEKEHQVLEACLARLLSHEGVTSIGMLAGVCADLLRTPRR